MTTALGESVAQVQNPALGALLLWRFAAGYQEARNDAGGCPVPLLFLVLAATLHEPTLDLVRSTQRRSGLRAFAAKFTTSQSNASDVLLTLHDRALRVRALSHQSLRFALRFGLLVPNLYQGRVFARGGEVRKKDVSASVLELARAAEKLGTWCAPLTLLEISIVLKVRF